MAVWAMATRTTIGDDETPAIGWHRRHRRGRATSRTDFTHCFAQWCISRTRLVDGQRNQQQRLRRAARRRKRLGLARLRCRSGHNARSAALHLSHGRPRARHSPLPPGAARPRRATELSPVVELTVTATRRRSGRGAGRGAPEPGAARARDGLALRRARSRSGAPAQRRGRAGRPSGRFRAGWRRASTSCAWRASGRG